MKRLKSVDIMRKLANGTSPVGESTGMQHKIPNSMIFIRQGQELII
jgi:hypothetical protein